MQVVYAKSTLEKFIDAVAEAKRLNKTIERIDLSLNEAEDMYLHVIMYSVLSFRRPSCREFRESIRKGNVTYRGVKLGLLE